MAGEDGLVYADESYLEQVRAEAMPLLVVAMVLAPVFILFDVFSSVRRLFRSR